MYKNIICFFSFLFVTRNVRMCRVRENWRWLKGTYTGATAHNFCNISPSFFVVLPSRNSSLVYIIFLTSTYSLWSHLPTTHLTWTRLLSSMLLTQFTRHFHWGNTCILVTLGNGCIPCYATPATYAAFPLGYLHPVYFWKQVYIG